MLPSPDHGHLMPLVLAADDDLSAAAADGAILRVSDLAPVAESFTWFPLEGTHPLEMLMGFSAPPHWRALGVSCAGFAHRLDAAGRPRPGADADAVTVTVLVDRSGAAAGLLRRSDEVTPLPGQPEGVVADACRRALELPTAPPPRSTLELWTLSWLDRLVDVASRADAASRLQSWRAVAALHAAVGPPVGRPTMPVDPVALATSATALAEAWTWARLRDEPGVLDLPGPPPSPPLARWMDDGMWARWLLSRLPSGDDLMAAVRALLPPALADGVAVVVQATWGSS
jgi:hypothetical protein